jgi:hypothetical protein
MEALYVTCETCRGQGCSSPVPSSFNTICRKCSGLGKRLATKDEAMRVHCEAWLYSLSSMLVHRMDVVANLAEFVRLQVSQELEPLKKFQPTSEQINALPEKLRKYIHDIETNCDQTGVIREAIVQRENAEALALRVQELQKELNDTRDSLNR